MPDSQKDLYKKILGRSGENRAVKFIKKAGLKVLERNYRTRTGEIDIIAKDGDEIVFVEVKTRSGDGYGAPAEAVDAFKQKKYAAVASEYLRSEELFDCPCRFDVVEVGKTYVNHIKDAFFV